jgi:hypothetical protein
VPCSAETRRPLRLALAALILHLPSVSQRCHIPCLLTASQVALNKINNPKAMFIDQRQPA